MNKIRAVQDLNKREIENGISPNASWHVDYRDTAYIYFGGLPFELSEGDIITVFSQYGEPTFIKLARDAETGKSRGFGWLRYEDQRSTDLAVDNLGGAKIGERMMSVDHARYKARDDDDPEEGKCGWEDMRRMEREERRARGERSEDEMEIEEVEEDGDLMDPMKGYLEDERTRKTREEKEERSKRRHRSGRDERHRRKHRHRSDRSRRDDSSERDSDRHRHRERGQDDRR